MPSRIPEPLKSTLVATAVAASVAAGGGVAFLGSERPSASVLLAHEIGAYYESSGKHIGTPYIDKIGKGQPWTVCNGVTGKDVIPGKYYSEAECKQLEIAILQKAERAAKGMFLHWGDYNVWVQASMIDMLYNLGNASLVSSTLLRKANAGDLTGACNEMTRWVYGTVNGVKTRLGGLVGRRGSTQEVCLEWGRSGHFSESLIEEVMQE